MESTYPITRYAPQRTKPVLDVSVVFTTVKATLLALRTADQLARDLHSKIVLVVPHVVSYSVPLEEPPVMLDWNEQRFRVFANSNSVETTVHVYLCRDRQKLLKDILKPRSLVVIGFRQKWWRRSSAEPLARLLCAHGCEVLVVRD